MSGVQGSKIEDIDEIARALQENDALLKEMVLGIQDHLLTQSQQVVSKAVEIMDLSRIEQDNFEA